MVNLLIQCKKQFDDFVTNVSSEVTLYFAPASWNDDKHLNNDSRRVLFTIFKIGSKGLLAVLIKLTYNLSWIVMEAIEYVAVDYAKIFFIALPNALIKVAEREVTITHHGQLSHEPIFSPGNPK